MNKEKNRFNVEEHTTLDNKIIDVFPISHKYIHNLEQQVKKQKEIIDNAIEYVENRIVEDDYMLRVDTDMVQKELLDILEEVTK